MKQEQSHHNFTFSLSTLSLLLCHMSVVKVNTSFHITLFNTLVKWLADLITCSKVIRRVVQEAGHRFSPFYEYFMRSNRKLVCSGQVKTVQLSWLIQQLTRVNYSGCRKERSWLLEVGRCFQVYVLPVQPLFDTLLFNTFPGFELLFLFSIIILVLVIFLWHWLKPFWEEPENVCMCVTWESILMCMLISFKAIAL